MANYQGWSVKQNQLLSINSPTPIGAVGGDNATPFYLFFPQMPAGQQWVFPFVYGFLYPLPVPQFAAVFCDASQVPAGAQKPTAGSTALAQLSAYQQTPGVSFSFAPGTPSIASTISRWNIQAQPAAGSQATASKAAIAGVVHVGDSAVFGLTQNATTADPARLAQILDGATILAQCLMGITATTGSAENLPLGPGLNFRGTAGNAMIVQFNGGSTTGIESVSLSGFDQ